MSSLTPTCLRPALPDVQFAFKNPTPASLQLVTNVSYVRVRRTKKKKKKRATNRVHRSATCSGFLCAVRPRVLGLFSADCLQTNKQKSFFFRFLFSKAAAASPTPAARIDEVEASAGPTGTRRPHPRVLRRRDRESANWLQKPMFLVQLLPLQRSQTCNRVQLTPAPPPPPRQTAACLGGLILEASLTR